MLKIKFWRIENVVLMKVLEQDEKLRGSGLVYRAKNGLEIRSAHIQEMTPSILYIRGDESDRDENIITQTYKKVDDAIKWYKKYTDAVKEYNRQSEEKEEGFDEVCIVGE